MCKEEILILLEQINFLNRSKILAETHKRDERNEISLSKEAVFAVIKKCGYVPKYNKAGNTYSATEKVSDIYKIKMVFEIKYSAIDFRWTVYENDKYIFGGPWLVIETALAKDLDYRVGRPVYKSEEEFEEILSTAFQMFRDFQNLFSSIS
ncbi:MAG: hypothetical protein J5717_03765 [Lachnospiraceae bacterium]|nr:hypothetical protein [Lachnospiraceae bacterium]